MRWLEGVWRSPATGAIGWVVFTVWEAAWLLGLPIGIDASLRHQFLVGGLFCLIVATGQSFWALLSRNRVLVAQIKLLESQPHPRLRLREPGAIHMDPISAFRPPMQQPILTADFIHVRFVNDPERPEPSAVAESVAAKVTFSRNGQILRTVDGRWSDVNQPQFGQSVLPLLRARFDIGDEHNVDIAFKVLGDKACYIFNNDNYHADDWRKLEHALDPGRYDVTVRLLGVHVLETFSFAFTNPGVGQTLIIHLP